MEKMLDGNYTRMLRAILNKSKRQYHTKQQLYPSRKLFKLDEPDMRDTAGVVRTKSWVTYSCEPLHMDEQRQDDQLEPIYNSSVPIQNITLKSSRERWTIKTGSERVREIRAGKATWWWWIYVRIYLITFKSWINFLPDNFRYTS